VTENGAKLLLLTRLPMPVKIVASTRGAWENASGQGCLILRIALVGEDDEMKLDSIVGVTLVACALIVTGIVVRREVLGSAALARAEQKPVMIAHWREGLEKGVRIGPREAPVQLIEFADFECPYCASFHKVLNDLRIRYPTQVALTFVHFPLPMHRFAEPAARVAECAGDQGRFEAMHGLLFEQQDKFGLKSWSEFATEAGVADNAAFEACIKSTDPIPRVVEGKALGKELDVKGTPTVVINGWKLGRPPMLDELDQMVKAILAGKSPVGST
jgi:protein-disulfide isomerase